MPGGLKSARAKEQRRSIVLMALATAVCVGVAPFAAVLALFSPLVFDARGNLINPLAWLGFLLMISLWIVCLVAPLAAWVFLRQKREPVAWSAMSAPLLWGLALVTVLQFVPA